MGVGILMRQKHCCAVCKTRQTDNTLQHTPTNNIEQNRALLKSVETLRLYAANILSCVKKAREENKAQHLDTTEKRESCRVQKSRFKA